MRHLLLLLFASFQVRCHQDYTLPLLGHGIEGETYSVEVLYLLTNYGKGGSSVKVTKDTGENIDIPGSDSTIETMNLLETDLPNQSQLKNKTRTVSADRNISMQVITTIHGHSEGYQAIPNNELGNEYYASTLCAFGGYCQVVIGSTVEGTTQVYVKLPAEVDEIGFCIKNGTWYSKFNTTITLNYPEVVQLETTHDLTGTRIYSDKPIAVVAGSRTINGSTPMYHLAEQLVPVLEWGTEFFVHPFGANAYGNVVHVTSRNRKTFVTMDGFNTVELTGYGQTIKRRIALGSVVRIKSSQPVQVMLYTGFTYASNETILNPGMTLVPAIEHWLTEAHFVCHAKDPNDVMQIIKTRNNYLLDSSAFDTPTPTTVEYTDKEFVEYEQELSRTQQLKITHTDGFAGIMTCDSTAIFPIRLLKLQQPDGGCYETLAEAYPNDGIDNDCDGKIDEDYCYENRVFLSGAYSLVNHTFFGQTSYSENISDFTLIKFRLRSCGDVKIELVAGIDKLVISIAKEVFIIYNCLEGSGCESQVFQTTKHYTDTADCNTLVPYWIQKTRSNMLCMGVGPFPDTTCASPTGVNVTDTAFTNMTLFGLQSNAVFYYDVFRADCGGLESDWRCTDMANNCLEYESKLCTEYADWARINCRKFCNFCSPDSVGKMFVVLTPPVPYGDMEFHVIAANMPESTFNSVNSEHQSVKFESRYATRKDGAIITKMTSVGSTTDQVHIVYTSAESHLTVSFRSGQSTVSIPIFPIDTMGTEYMAMSFSPELQCIVSSIDGPTKARKYTKGSPPTVLDVSQYTLASMVSTGTIISTDRPVAVFCYSVNPNYPYLSQLSSTSSWGTDFILPALNTSNHFDSFNATVRLLAYSANTRINISGDFQSLELIAERGNYLDQSINVDVTYRINSNFPIAVAVLYEDTTSGTKSTATIPSVDNYMESSAMIFHNLLGPVYFSEVDVDRNVTTFIPDLTDTNISSSFFYETQASPSLALSIVSDTNVVQMSGHLVKDLQTARICTVTTGEAGDGVDNDCDGLVDEEALCQTGYGTYNNDSDLDANFGEDCLVSNDDDAEPPPAIPMCFQLIFPINGTQHCYTPCTCPCEWVDELLKYDNMTQEEKDASNLKQIQPIIRLLQVDKKILSNTIAEKESAVDTRASSANIGLVGIAMLTLICCLIGCFDFINVIRYFKSTNKANIVMIHDID